MTVEIGRWTREWAQKNGIAHSYFDEIPSTNDVAKQNFNSDQGEIKVYITDHQTRGRGRGSNSWINPKPGTALLSSWSLPLAKPPQHTTAPLCGISLLRAAQSVWPSLQWSLKAPNDLYLGNGKLAGILIESVSSGTQHRLIFGLGMNIAEAPSQIPEALNLMSEEGIGSNLTQEKWFQFLNAFHEELKVLSVKCGNTLEEEDRNYLLKALNVNPQRQALFVEISPDGDLIAEDQVLKWTEL